MKQLQQKKDEEARHKSAASESQKVLSGDGSLDLRRFGKKFGSAKHSNGAGKAQEAPARFRTQVNTPQ